MTTKVLFLNGPPGCGKDFVGRLIATRWVGRIHVDKFARVLKESTHALYGITIQSRPVDHDWFEACKDEPRLEFFGLTPRQAYIAVSETYMKPQHGDRIFGELLLRQLRIKAADVDLIVITDSGFRGEAEVLIDSYGAENCTLLHLHRVGHTFQGDSRNWIDLSDLGVRCCTIVNNGNEDDLLESLNVAKVAVQCDKKQ